MWGMVIQIGLVEQERIPFLLCQDKLLQHHSWHYQTQTLFGFFLPLHPTGDKDPLDLTKLL